MLTTKIIIARVKTKKQPKSTNYVTGRVQAYFRHHNYSLTLYSSVDCNVYYLL